MNKEVVVVTDSTACLTEQMAREHHVTVVPIWVIFGEYSYRDGVDISNEEFYSRLIHADPLPKTSSPSPGDYLKVYTKLREESNAILVITYSSRFGMSYQSARLASEMIDGVQIAVVDSCTATMAQGFIALGTARAVAAGAGIEEAVKVAQEMIPRVGFLARLETLTYLHRSGRVPEIADWIGKALKLQLVFGSSNGSIHVVGASRTSRQALNQILDELRDRTGGKKLDVAIFHAEAAHQAEQLKEKLLSRFEVDEFYCVEMTPVVGAHTGPGVVGLAYCLDNPLYNLSADSGGAHELA